MRLVIDTENDNLLQGVTRSWIIGYKNLDTGEVKYWLEGDLGWKEDFDKCTVAIGHNIVAYDEMVLEKLFNYHFPKTTKVHDTMLMSLVLNYNKFPNSQHSLANWGEFLGLEKLEFHDFSHFSQEMLTYWKRDLDVTEKVYHEVFKEYKLIAARNTKIGIYLRAENAIAKFCSRAELYGWPFDKPAAEKLLEVMEAERKVCSDLLLPKLGNKTVAVDKEKGVVPPKIPKWRKDGAYDSHTCKWFGIDEWSGACEDRLVEGPYSRIQFVDLDVNSVTDVKIFLFRHGWQPTEWNTKPNPVGRGLIKTSPKITEDSLECMEGNGKLYCDFLTTSSRAGILKGWIKNCDENGRLHGECFTIGTPSFRARHSIIVNVPAADSRWGPEMRSLFIVKPGWKMVGSDSSGNQARGLAHYLKSPEYVELLLHGDVHTHNADVLTQILLDMGIVHKVPRGIAKRVLYAYLFGASGTKMWSYILNTQDELKGKKLKLGFTKAVPGLKNLLDKLENIFGDSKKRGDGYVPSVAGNKIYCTSFHKLLVYLLQAMEKATCACACMLLVQYLEEEKIPYQPLIFYHDELDFMVPEEFAERAAELGKRAFQEGPKLMGVTIMDGESKIGLNWFECH
jgi:DNA polymerase-1